MSFLTHLVCSACGKIHAADVPQSVCTACGKPLLAEYDMERLAAFWRPSALWNRPPNMWRYAEVLPATYHPYFTLGEGFTPLIPFRSLGNVWLKEEAQNPTGSFKARGLSMAVNRARELGLRHLAIPSAGNAAGALATYCARNGLTCTVFMPESTPEANVAECRMAGAEVHLVPGSIADAARALEAYRKDHPEVFNVATLREPYRLEGKKTMGYELFEQSRDGLPDVIIYPTGGGTGLIGMWKAFDEMQRLGWIDGERPRMVAVQSAGCAPIVRAFEQDLDHAPPWEHPQTIASGLRVPAALGDFLILRILRESEGTAVAVPDEEILQAMRDLAVREGLLLCPEGAATYAAYRRLRESGWIEPDDQVVLFNTGSPYKYTEVMQRLYSSS